VVGGDHSTFWQEERGKEYEADFLKRVPERNNMKGLCGKNVPWTGRRYA